MRKRTFCELDARKINIKNCDDIDADFGPDLETFAAKKTCRGYDWLDYFVNVCYNGRIGVISLTLVLGSKKRPRGKKEGFWMKLKNRSRKRQAKELIEKIEAYRVECARNGIYQPKHVMVWLPQRLKDVLHCASIALFLITCAVGFLAIPTSGLIGVDLVTPCAIAMFVNFAVFTIDGICYEVTSEGRRDDDVEVGWDEDSIAYLREELERLEKEYPVAKDPREVDEFETVFAENLYAGAEW